MTYRKSSKMWSQTTRIFFVRMDYAGLSGDFHPISTQISIHPSDTNHPGTVFMSLRL